MRRRFLLAGAAALALPGRGQTQDAAGTEDIRDPASGARLSLRDLVDRLEAADTILIGERHGFAPHQDRVAFLIQALAERGRYPRLALEMLEPAQIPMLEAYRRQNPEYARGLGAALDWPRTGWPDWQFYEPIFQAAFSARLPILAADLPRAEQRRIETEGTDARPDDPAVLDRWRDRMNRAYCGILDERALERVALTQWRRDQEMQATLDDGNCLLLAGIDHVAELRAEVRVRLEHSTDAAAIGADILWMTEADPRRGLC